MLTKPPILDETGQKILSGITRIKDALLGTTSDPVTPGSAGTSGVEPVMQDDTGRDIITALNDLGTAIKPASATDNGYVSTGTQTFAGQKTFTDALHVNNYAFFSGGSARYPSIFLSDANATAYNSSIFLERGTTTDNKLNNPRIGFEIRGADSSQNPTEYFERFRLPVVSNGITATKEYNIITTKNLTDIPDASATQRGVVNTDSQSFGGVKTFAGRYVNIRAKNGYPALRFLNEAQGQLLGTVFPNMKTVNDVSVCDRMYIRQYSYNSTTGAFIDQWDQYLLPTATPDRTASANYSILTSKSPVTIAQGGTGQTATNHSTVATNMTLTAWGKNRMLDFNNYTISYATIVTLSDENRPNTVAHGICRWQHTNNTYYPALVTIASTGVVSASYWNGTSSAAISNGTLTGTICWIAK